mmetsp:Transcript_10589/g.65166  ORF Transcript_10589/g.65166 Transcript_10589/m.65166 type:complete len:512 (+) Transcript_10589:12693-14228(+)
MVVRFVHQGDETPRAIVVVKAKPRNVAHKQRVKGAAQGHVIGWTQRSTAKLLKVKFGRAARCHGHVQFATKHRGHFHRRAFVAEPFHAELLEGMAFLRIGGIEVGLRGRGCLWNVLVVLCAIVDPGFDPVRFHAAVELVREVQVQVIQQLWIVRTHGRTVGGGHDHASLVHGVLEQSLQCEQAERIHDLHLVEAKDPGVRFLLELAIEEIARSLSQVFCVLGVPQRLDSFSGRRSAPSARGHQRRPRCFASKDRFFFCASLLAWCSLVSMQQRVELQHGFVVVDSSFRHRVWHALVEQVHEHRFSASYRAVQIHPFRFRGFRRRCSQLRRRHRTSPSFSLCVGFAFHGFQDALRRPHVFVHDSRHESRPPRRSTRRMGIHASSQRILLRSFVVLQLSDAPFQPSFVVLDGALVRGCVRLERRQSILQVRQRFDGALLRYVGLQRSCHQLLSIPLPQPSSSRGRHACFADGCDTSRRALPRRIRTVQDRMRTPPSTCVSNSSRATRGLRRTA